jgi:hypothetical protein
MLSRAVALAAAGGAPGAAIGETRAAGARRTPRQVPWQAGARGAAPPGVWRPGRERGRRRGAGG